MTTKHPPRLMWMAAVGVISVLPLIAIHVTLLLADLLVSDALNPRRVFSRAIANINQAKLDKFKATLIPPVGAGSEFCWNGTRCQCRHEP